MNHDNITNKQFLKQKKSTNQSKANIITKGSKDSITPYTRRITEKKIESSEDEVVKLASELIVSDINKLQEAGNLHQYQRRACIKLDDISPNTNETTEEINKKAKNV